MDRRIAIILAAVLWDFGSTAVDLKAGEAMVFEIKSPAFAQGQAIPKKYTCDGSNDSVPLVWTDPHAGTKSFAIIIEDPDAPMGTFVHWVLYDLPPEIRQLPEGVPKQKTLADGTKQGANDFGQIGYGGPCPPRGSAHRYFFKLYALDNQMSLPPSAAKWQVLDATQGHILGETQLMGTYKR